MRMGEAGEVDKYFMLFALALIDLITHFDMS